MQFSPHYSVIETLFRDGRKSLYRATREADHLPVVLKALDSQHRSKDAEQLRHEYELGSSLHLRAMVRPLALDTYQGLPVLIFEDSGGRSLDRRIAGPMAVEQFLGLAVRIAGAVADLHGQGVVHKDLKPQNILVHPVTMEVKLADLGLATRLPREQPAARPPQLIEGTLAYMSPEQTGRMNRAVDSRTDLYSLGVTFYQMLTGRLPFEASDPLEWVHCHLARAPTAPSQVVPEVPAAIEHIVLKLLAKMADDRYQTASGLRHDLVRCLEQWRKSGRIDPLPLGERDLPDRLQIPQRLYGRDGEVAALLGAFERLANTGSPELVLVSGYAGIGKSSLVHELEKPIVHRRGRFASGKFDQYQRDVPYSTIVQAFRELVLDLLVEGEERVAAWRQRLQGALGINAQLIVDVIPQVELVIGKQAPVPELPLSEARNRFHMVFRRFLGVFARAEQPLTLFLDDLQWADPASLALLQEMVTDLDTRFLLLVGAYRDNEVTPAHPLLRTLDAVRKAGAHVADIVLGPLSTEHLAAFISDALHCGTEEATPLAALVGEKTGANPFFAIQFLTLLYWQGLIAFDQSAGCWRWDVEKIRTAGCTDNVVELMVGKLRHLPVKTQEALELAACVGASVDRDTLALIFERDPEDALRPALEEDLLLRVEGTYRFPHDRVQEAAYSLIPECERATAHLRIGRMLWARTAPKELEERIFGIVNQLDRGAALISSREEREQVAELNLIAGQRAKRATAYASALKYLAAGRPLLAEDSWDRRYELTFALELHRAECEYLSGELAAAEERLSMLRRRAGNLVDAAAVTCAQVALYTTLDRSDRSVETCLDYLRRLGVQWSPHPTAEEVRQEYEWMWQQLGKRSIEELIDLPPMVEPEWCATLDVLTWGTSPALFTDENLLCLLVGRMANLSLQHGNSDGSCLAYVRLGMVLGPHFGDYRAGFRFGKLGIDLVEKRGLLRFKARTYLGFGHLVNPWTRNMRSGIELVRRAFDAAQETGDLTYASYACNCLITLLLASGDPLGELQREAERALGFVRQARFGLVVDIITGQLRLMRTLRGLTPDFSSFNDADFDEGQFEQHLESDPGLAIATCWYWIRKLQARFYAGDYAAALEAAAKAQRLLWTSPSFLEVAEYHLYAALARAARCDPASRREHREALVAHCKQLELWADNCPENFLDRYALVSAELARVEGRELDAQRLYEQAIRSARDHGFVQNEALAYELASRFYRARGYEHFADTYLRDARSCYGRWGADGKVRQLEQLYPQLHDRWPLVPTATFVGRAEQLDLLSVVKASQTISGEIDFERLLSTLLRVVLEQGGADRACLILVRDGNLSMEAEAVTGENGVTTRLLPSLPLMTAGDRPPTQTSPPVPSSVIHYARQTREPVILDDAALRPGKFSSDPYVVHQRPRSVLCLPILRQAVLVGILYLENNVTTGAFTSERLAALTLLASQAAISVENALLLAKERASRTAAEEAHRRTAFLAEAGALLSESLDYQETLVRLGRLCIQSLADTCVLDIVEGREIRRVAGACADPAKEPLLEQLQQRHPARWDSPHPAARSLRSGQPILAPVITDEFLRRHCDDEEHMDLIRAIGIRSAVAVPLVARGQTLGVFTMGSSTPGRYGRADLELAQELAQRAAIAVDNARLYGAAQQAIRLRDEFLSCASHELRTPIQSLQLVVQSLGRSLHEEHPSASSKMLDIAARQTQRLTALVSQLLDVVRIQSGPLALTLEEFDLVADTRRILERMQLQFEQAGCPVRLHAQEAIAGRWDRSRIDQILTNLLSNALAYGAGQPIDLTLERVSSDGPVRITLRDRGIGIPAERLPHIFERFERATSTRHYGGLGLGLFIARQLAQAHGGTISVESEPGRGSSFTVDLPLAPRESGPG